jgi:hypothetical protein
VTRFLWFALGLFALGEVVAALWWLLPDNLHVVPVLLGLIGFLYLVAFTTRIGGAPSAPPVRVLDELEAMRVVPYRTEDPAAQRTALHNEEDE